MRRVHVGPVILVGTIVTVAAAAVSLGVGVVHIPLRDVARALGEALTGGAGASTDYTLVVDMRLPRAVGALCVGASLGLAGCILQSLLRNPLASPLVMGTAQGAGFGAVLAISLRFAPGVTFLFAFVMSVVATALVLWLARTQRSLPMESVVLTGLSMSLLFGALIGLVRFLAHDEGVLGRIALWILGGLWQVTWEPLRVMGTLALVAVVLSCLLWRPLDLLALGQEDAQRLGLRVRRVGTAVLLLSCVMTSLAICIGGVVAFVGLIVPHAARRLVGPAHSALMPACAFLGGVFVIATDTVARTVVPPQELPLGVVTSLIGVPAFLVILRSLRAKRAAL